MEGKQKMLGSRLEEREFIISNNKKKKKHNCATVRKKPYSRPRILNFREKEKGARIDKIFERLIYLTTSNKA